MSIWNKVLLGLNILVSFGVFYLAIQTLNVHRVWRESARDFETRLDQVNNDIETLQQGPDGNGGIRAVRMKLYAELINRGRVWYDCKPQAINNPEDINVVVTQPSPNNLEKNLVVNVFEYVEKKDGAAADPAEFNADPEAARLRPMVDTTRFLGEFVVMSAGENIQIAPTMKLSERATANLMASKGPWMIRELMPADSHTLFADMPEEKLRALLPEEVVDEYLKDGKDSFVRSLRDYRTLLNWYDQRLAKQIEVKEAVTRYNESLDASLADATEQEKFRKQLNSDLQQELIAMKFERDTVLAYEASLEKELQDLMQEIDNLMNKNRVLAQTIQQFQEQAIMQINSRTASTQ